ncbi:MAG: hypothetical protein AABZ10_09320 [Nitrospirota bacterium]
MNMLLFIELVAVLIMAGGLGGIFYDVLKNKKNIDSKTIQLTAVVFVLPLLLVLGLEGKIGRETIGTLFGIIFGYVLSGTWKQ